MSARKRKSSVTKKHASEPDVPTVEETLATTSNQDVESEAEMTAPSKQVKFEESTKAKASNVPATQPSVSGKSRLDYSLSEKQKEKESKSIGKFGSALGSSSTSTGSSKDRDFSFSKTIGISPISSDESNPSSVASGENALEIDEDSDGKNSTTSDVQGPETVERKPRREPSMFDVGDITTSSSSSNKSDDTISSLSSF